MLGCALDSIAHGNQSVHRWLGADPRLALALARQQLCRRPPYAVMLGGYNLQRAAVGGIVSEDTCICRSTSGTLVLRLLQAVAVAFMAGLY